MVKRLILSLKNQIKLKLLLLSLASTFLFFLSFLKTDLVIFFLLYQIWFYFKHLPQIKKIAFSFIFLNLWFLFLLNKFNDFNYLIIFCYFLLNLVIIMFLNFQYKKESLNFLFLNDLLILFFLISYFSSQFFLNNIKYLSQVLDFLRLSNGFFNYFFFIFIIFFFLKEFFSYFNLSGQRLIFYSFLATFLSFELLILINLLSFDFFLASILLFLFLISYKNIFLKHYKGEISYGFIFTYLFFVVLVLSLLVVFVLL